MGLQKCYKTLIGTPGKWRHIRLRHKRMTYLRTIKNDIWWWNETSILRIRNFNRSTNHIRGWAHFRFGFISCHGRCEYASWFGSQWEHDSLHNPSTQLRNFYEFWFALPFINGTIQNEFKRSSKIVLRSWTMIWLSFLRENVLIWET